MSDAFDNVTLEPGTIERLESFRLCFDAVSKERVHLGRVEAPTPSVMKGMFDSGQKSGIVYRWAVANDEVIGWTTIVPGQLFGLSHSGDLGMGVRIDYRRQGIGTRLMRSAIEAAWNNGLERIELKVWSDNQPAIALYEKLGFRHEGILKNYRYLDGKYTDAVMMALLRDN